MKVFLFQISKDKRAKLLSLINKLDWSVVKEVTNNTIVLSDKFKIPIEKIKVPCNIRWSHTGYIEYERGKPYPDRSDLPVNFVFTKRDNDVQFFKTSTRRVARGDDYPFFTYLIDHHRIYKINTSDVELLSVTVPIKFQTLMEHLTGKFTLDNIKFMTSAQFMFKYRLDEYIPQETLISMMKSDREDVYDELDKYMIGRYYLPNKVVEYLSLMYSISTCFEEFPLKHKDKLLSWYKQLNRDGIKIDPSIKDTFYRLGIIMNQMRILFQNNREQTLTDISKLNTTLDTDVIKLINDQINNIING